jgi:hypothetical protein
MVVLEAEIMVKRVTLEAEAEALEEQDKIQM